MTMRDTDNKKLRRELEREVPDAPEVVIRWIDEYRATHKQYLWEDFIPLGEVTVVWGDGGVGKTTLLDDLAARISSNAPMPNGEKPVSGRVLIVGEEDSIEKVVKPRLREMGADLKNKKLGFIKVQISDDMEDDEGIDDIHQYLPVIDEQIVELGDVRMLRIDPLSDCAGPFNLDKTQDCRRLLRPLRKLARRHNIAVVVINHLNKNQEQSGKHRGGGSLAIQNVSRSAVLVAEDQADPNRRLAVISKTNYSKVGVALGFEIVERQRRHDKVVSIDWDDELGEADPDELLSKKTSKETKLTRAIKFLRQELENGPVRLKELQERAREDRIAWPTIKRAKKDAGAKSWKPRGKPYYVWGIKPEGGGSKSNLLDPPDTKQVDQ